MKLVTPNLFFKLVIIITCIIANTSDTSANFEYTGTGARATGMNDAYTAAADDVYSIYYNPAGLVNLTSPEFSSYYGKMYMGLSDNSKLGNSFFAYAHPIKLRNSFIKESRIDDKFGERNLGTFGAGYREFSLDGLYKETVLSLSYARMLVNYLAMGLTVKSMGVSYGTNEYTRNAIGVAGVSKGVPDPLFENGSSKRVMSYDFGFLYTRLADTKLGLTFSNINQPDISLKSAGDRVNLCAKFGVSRKFNFGTVNVDVVREKRVSGSTDTDVLIGYEEWLGLTRYGDMAVRCGFGEGSRDYRRASMGFSYRINMVQMDYAFSVPLKGLEDSLGSHRIAMTFRFAEKPDDDELGEMMEKEAVFFMEAKEELKAAAEEKKTLEFEIKKLHAEIDGIKEEDIAQKEEKLKKLEGRIEQAKKKYSKAFDIAKRFYSKRVKNSGNLKTRIIILEKVCEKYNLVGVDVTDMENDLNKMKREFNRKTKDYDMAVKYYRLLVNKGVPERDRRDILRKMISKFSVYGINTREARNELIKLEKNK